MNKLSKCIFSLILAFDINSAPIISKLLISQANTDVSNATKPAQIEAIAQESDLRTLPVLLDQNNPNLPLWSDWRENLLNLTYNLVDNAHVHNPETIKKLIKCESYAQNVSRPDSDGIISDGILQFHRDKKYPDVVGSGTWSEFSKQSGIMGSPLNPYQAILMTDWAIDHNLATRWSCWWIQKRAGKLL